MSPEMYCCCTKQSSLIFVYEDKSVWGICETHFLSLEHRVFVKNVIHIATRKLHKPQEIFKEVIPAQ